MLTQFYPPMEKGEAKVRQAQQAAKELLDVLPIEAVYEDLSDPDFYLHNQ